MQNKQVEVALSEPSVQAVRDWWSTQIIDIKPGSIRVRGYPIQELIGQVGLAQMIWLMFRGELPDPRRAALLEAALVAAVDHGPQAPSISIARMSMTCGVGINNAVASGLNALGDVHGGAGQQCMALFYELAEQARQEGASLEDVALRHARHALSGKRIVPGFGHRFHKTDPRAQRLQALLAQAPPDVIDGSYMRLAHALQSAISGIKGGPVALNIDGALAAVLCELGFDALLGRGLFVLSRAVGICAHAYEQSIQGGRIKGPSPPSVGYLYNGPEPRTLSQETSNED